MLRERGDIGRCGLDRRVVHSLSAFASTAAALRVPAGRCQQPSLECHAQFAHPARQARIRSGGVPAVIGAVVGVCDYVVCPSTGGLRGGMMPGYVQGVFSLDRVSSLDFRSPS